MAKKALATIEEGNTAASVAVGCATLLDAGLAEQLGPAMAEDEGLGNGGQLVVRAAQRLQTLKHNLELCQEALARVPDELRPWRRQRDDAQAELYEAIRDLRRFCRGIFEKDSGDAFLGLHGDLPREPKELHAACGPLVRRLADLEWPMPKQVVLQAFQMDRDTTVRTVREAHVALGEALLAIQEGETREAVAQAAKNRSADAHRIFLHKSSRFFEAALELAGLDDLAAAVRPKVGRRGRPPKQLVPPQDATSAVENPLLESAQAPDQQGLPAAEPVVTLAPPASDEAL